jgi:hypothetical protein
MFRFTKAVPSHRTPKELNEISACHPSRSTSPFIR